MEELLEEKKFEMRAYDKAELALLYCPGRFLRREVEQIVRHLGEP